MSIFQRSILCVTTASFLMLTNGCAMMAMHNGGMSSHGKGGSVMPSKSLVVEPYASSVDIENMPDDSVTLPSELKTNDHVLLEKDKSSNSPILPILGGIGMVAMMVIMML